MKTLEQLLKESALIKPEDLKKALHAQKAEGWLLSAFLLRNGFITPKGFEELLTQKTTFPLATPGMLHNVPPGILNILSSDVVERFFCYPLDVVSHRLFVAFLDPTDQVAVGEVHLATGMEIEAFCANPVELLKAINEGYDIELPSWVEEKLAAPAPPPLEDILPPIEKAPPVLKPVAKKEEPEVEVAPPKIGKVIKEVPPLKPAPEPIRKLRVFEPTHEPTAKVEIKPEAPKEEVTSKEVALPPPEEEKTAKIERKIALVSPFPQPPFAEKPQQFGEKEEPTTSPKYPGALSEEFEIPAEARAEIKAEPIVGGHIDTTPPPEPRGLFTPEPTTDSFDALREAMGEVSDKEQIAREVIGWLQKQPVSRGAIFVVQKGIVSGWRGFGNQLEGPSASRIKLTLEEPSIFKTVVETKESYFGGVLESEVNQQFVNFLQSRPQNIYLLPIVLNDRVIGMLFAEVKPNETVNANKQLVPLAEAVARGFTTLIGRKKGTEKKTA